MERISLWSLNVSVGPSVLGPQASGPGEALSGLWERLPGVKWPKAGLISCSRSLSGAGCRMAKRRSSGGVLTDSDSKDGSQPWWLWRGRHSPSAKGGALHLMAIQCVFLEGVNGSLVLLNRECPKAQGAVMAGGTLGLVCVRWSDWGIRGVVAAEVW